jgi:cell division protein ZapA
MDTAAGRKTVRVTIFNQSYSLLATEEAGEVESLAQTVDELMTGIAQKAGNIDSHRVAVLACLHMADQLKLAERQLVELKERVDEKSREFTILLDQAHNGHA